MAERARPQDAEGEDRRQETLLPDYLDDHVGRDNPVRIAEAFFDELKLAAPTCWGSAGGNGTAYHSSTLLKISIDVYFNPQPPPLEPEAGARDPAQL